MQNLKILEKKQNIINNRQKTSNNHLIKHLKHYIPSNKEWFNSMYFYNKGAIKYIPALDNYILRLIREHFNSFFKLLEEKSKLPHIRRSKRRFSIVRILVSKAELKHTSDKVVINLFVFNRQRFFYINSLKKIKLGMLNLKKSNLLTSLNITNLFNNKFKDLQRNIELNNNFNLRNYENIKNKLKLKLINNNSKNIMTFMKEHNILCNINNYTVFHSLKKKVRLLFIKKFFKIEKFYLLFKQNLFINNSKFKSTYLYPLIQILEKIYLKKVKFNIITLKYPYLNSDIYLQLIITKLRNRKNRILKLLYKSLALVRTPRRIRLATLGDVYSNKLIIGNLPIHKSFNNTDDMYETHKDKLSIFISNNTNLYNKMSNDYISDVLKYIKYKTFIGIRIEASGRLTKRLIASRAISKVITRGGVKNIYSSVKGLSTTLSRGVLASGNDLSKKSSKTLIGSYGLKSWVNSM